MKIYLNHEPIEVSGSEQNLQSLLEREGLAKPGIAVAVDNKVVPRKEWPLTPLHENMRLTIIHAVCGG